VWHEFCVRHGRSMSRAGIGRRSNWGSEYSLSVEVFDRKGGFRLFCSYGRLSITSQVRRSIRDSRVIGDEAWPVWELSRKGGANAAREGRHNRT
jgi:hypothetical protein